MFKITLRSKIKQICSPDVATTIIIVIITAKARLLEITGGEQPGRKCSHETGSQVTSDYFFSVFSFSAGHDKETEAEKAFIDARRYLKNTHSHTWRSHNSVCEETPVYAPSPLHTHTHTSSVSSPWAWSVCLPDVQSKEWGGMKKKGHRKTKTARGVLYRRNYYPNDII